MTVTTSTSRDIYNCSGETTYSFTFGVEETSEVQVILTDADGINTTLTETTHYTVSATNSDYSSGGTVTTVTAYAAPNKITILRNTPFTQDSDFTEGMSTLYETFENGLDKLTRLMQQLKEVITRCITLPVSGSASASLPALVANTYLAVNASGDGIELHSLIDQGAISNAAYDKDTWDGVEDIAPSKKAVRDALEVSALRSTAAEIAAGTESAKAVAPDQLALLGPVLGAANLKQFMNAAGTAKEWASGIKTTVITRATNSGDNDTNYDVAYTGIGFKPVYVIFIANVSGGTPASFGFDNGTLHYGMKSYYAETATPSWIINDDASIQIMPSGGSLLLGSILTMDVDGFTIRWRKTGSPAASTTSVLLLAFR